MAGRTDELNSWKDIASYLGVTVRTAQLWERERGLPVRRLPGPRGRVYAYVEELDAWKSGGSNLESASGADPTMSADACIPANARATARAGEAEAEAEVSDDSARGSVPQAHSEPSAWTRPRFVVTGLFCCAVLAVMAVTGVAKFRKGPPAKYEIKPDALIVKDAKGRELWRKPLKNALAYGQPYRPPVAFADVNGDGHTEVVFAPKMVENLHEALVCYAEDGSVLWRFAPGKQVRTVNETFLTPFDINSFIVGRFGAERGQRIVVVSLHPLYYPTQIALISGNGKLLREYWHSGQLQWPVVLDINKDGRDDIVLVGVHNATKNTTIVALDPETMRGASVEDNPDYQLQGFEPGNELRRIIIPRSCIGKAFRTLPSPQLREVTRNEIVIGVGETPDIDEDTASLYFHFTRDLTLRSIGVGSDFQAMHEKMYFRGELDHRLSNAEIEDLRRRVH